MSDAPPYDPDARRGTPLALAIAERIRAHGPMAVSDYMALCLQHPEHGYYRTRAAIGAPGDFVTAPEISQIFGELIGLWCAVVWQSMGSPARFDLIELGPGRGTLMADAVRAARRVPGFLDAARVTCIETNATLIGLQRAALNDSGCPVTWREALDAAVSDGAPAIVFGNEFLDCLPAAQAVITASGTRPRRVALDGGGRLVFEGEDVPRDTGETATSQAQAFQAWTTQLAQRAGSAPLTALFLDYGHTATAPGDTLQAVRNHAYEHPLTSPGEADLTVHVDFEAFAAAAGAQGFSVDGPVTQSEFLGSLGIIERASKLMAANPAHANGIEMAVARLIGPGAMGTRFHAIGLRSPALPPLPGLGTIRAGR
jgi:NADH dehydrogenase [ubiquinone] 1 alpha subcomplex assembly factor 7